MKSTRIVVALWLLLVCVLIIITARAQFTADLSAFLPRHPTVEQQLFIEQLQNGVVARSILVGIEGANSQTRAGLAKNLAQQLRSTTEFVAVNNGEQVAAERDREFLFANRYLLSPTVTEERFTSDGLRAAIANSIDLLASPAGMLIKPLIARDPTGEIVELLDQLSSNNGPRRSDGVWTSRDGERALLLVQTQAAGADTNGQEHALATIRAAFDRAQQATTLSGRDARMIMTGPGVFSVSSRDIIKSEVTRLSIVSTVAIIVLLLIVYRSLRTLALGTLPVLTGILAGIAAVSLGFGTVHGITVGFGVTLIGEAIDYSIYLFIQSEKKTVDNNESNPWLTNFWPTIRLGVMTSVVGFVALLFSDFPGLAQLGLYSTAGLITAAFVTRFVLPALLPVDFRVRDISALGSVLMKLMQHARFLRWLSGGLLLVACMIIFLHRSTLWNSDLSAMNPISTAARAADAQLRGDLGTADPRYLIAVSAESVESVLMATEHVTNLLQNLVDDGALGGFDSPSRYLPSVATQQNRLRALPNAAELTTRLTAAVADLPIRAATLQAFISDVETARHAKPLQYSDLNGTSLNLALNAMLIKQEHGWRALLPLRSVNAEGIGVPVDAARISAGLANVAPDSARFVDIKHELDTMYESYLQEAIHLSLAGLAAIVALLFFHLRSPKRVMRIVLPLAFATLVSTALLVVAGYQLTIIHLIGMLLIAAVGSNYALFFDRSTLHSNQNNLSRTLASLVFANISTVLVFGVLATSQVPVLQNIGMMVAPGVVLALIFSAIVAGRQKT